MFNNFTMYSMNLLENIVIIQIINSFFKVKNKLIEYLFIFLFSLFSFWINTMNYPFLLIIATIILCIYTLYNNLGLPIQKVLISTAVFGINAYLSFIIVAGLNNLDTTVAHLINERLSFYICIVIISKFILITLFSFIQTAFMKHGYKTDWKLILLELNLFFISVLLSFYIYINSYIKANTALILLVIIASTLLILFYFYNKYQNSKNKEKLQEIWELERRDYIKQSNQMHSFYGESYARSVKIRNCFDQLYKSIENDKESESINILNAIEDILFTQTDFGNEALNFLLNSKLQIMQAYNIKFQAAVSTALVEISQEDITFIIGTLLDSAIEQVKNKEDANINLHISKISAGSKIIIDYTPTYSINEITYSLSKINPLLKKYHGFSSYYKDDYKTYYKVVFMQEVN